MDSFISYGYSQMEKSVSATQQIKVVCISDTHGKLDPKDVPNGDVLIHCGDISVKKTSASNKYAFYFFNKLPHQYKIIVAGNHDSGLEFHKQAISNETMKKIPAEVASSISQSIQANLQFISQFYYLNDSGISLFGNKIWGCPYSLGNRGAFSYDKEELLSSHIQMIPTDTDILITHSPPLNILDLNKKGKHLGCASLKYKIDSIPTLKYHIFGHCHENHGVVVGEKTTFINCAVCNNKLEVSFKPTIIMIDKKSDCVYKL